MMTAFRMERGWDILSGEIIDLAFPDHLEFRVTYVIDNGEVNAVRAFSLCGFGSFNGGNLADRVPFAGTELRPVGQAG